MKRTISFLLSIIMMLTVLSGIEFVYASSWKAGDNVTVTVNNGVLTVSGTGSMYDYKSKEFPELPKWIVNNGYEVGSDGKVSGYNKIVIEKGVTTIGSFAFTGSMSVESVSIPDSVISIGERAFSGCYKLDSINLPSSVMALGSCAFSTGIEGLGSSLAEITVDESNRFFTVENGVLYDKIKTIIYKIPTLAKLTVLDTPNTVTTILEEAAVGCKNLTEVNLSPAVTVVEDNAFKDCRNLKKVVVNNDRCDLGVGSIPDNVGLMLYSDKDSKAALYTGNNNTKNIQFVPICEHVEVIDKAVAPTCTEPGLTQGSHCSVCEKIIVPQEIVKPTGHKYDAGKVTKAATCKTTGVKTYTCTACGDTKTEAIPKTAHKYDEGEVTKAATCTETGVKTYTCTVCGDIKTEAIPKTAHKYDEGEVTKAATCTETGVKTYTCTICGDTKTEEIPICEHIEVIDEAVAPTCTEPGLTQGSHCSVCEKIIVPQEIVKPTGHKYDEGKVTKAATCKATGIKTYTCTVCGDTKTEAIPKTAHKYDEGEVTKAATCTETGIKTYTCTVCGDTKIEAIPKTGHKYDKGEVTKAATCKATGVKTYTCTVCKATKTATIAKTAHTYKNYVTKATSRANGSIVNKCSVCGTKKSTTVIPLVKTFTLSATNFTYDGKVKTPAVTVKDSKGKTLKRNTDYTVSYSSGRKNVGKYVVKIVLKGNYAGTKTMYFNINPKGTSIVKVTPKSKAFTVSWNKQTNQTTGYQIQYSVYSNFKSAKTITMPKNTYYAKSITGLSGNKRYYVRIRTYKTVKFNGKNYNLYSPWSSTKYTTTKK